MASSVTSGNLDKINRDTNCDEVKFFRPWDENASAPCGRRSTTNQSGCDGGPSLTAKLPKYAQVSAETVCSTSAHTPLPSSLICDKYLFSAKGNPIDCTKATSCDNTKDSEMQRLLLATSVNKDHSSAFQIRTRSLSLTHQVEKHSQTGYNHREDGKSNFKIPTGISQAHSAIRSDNGNNSCNGVSSSFRQVSRNSAYGLVGTLPVIRKGLTLPHQDGSSSSSSWPSPLSASAMVRIAEANAAAPLLMSAAALANESSHSIRSLDHHHHHHTGRIAWFAGNSSSKCSASFSSHHSSFIHASVRQTQGSPSSNDVSAISSTVLPTASNLRTTPVTAEDAVNKDSWSDVQSSNSSPVPCPTAAIYAAVAASNPNPTSPPASSWIRAAQARSTVRWRPRRQRPKRFQCPHCRVSFSNNGQLKGHVRIHTGERPFACDHPNCGKTFTRNEELTRHRRIHTGLRPFPCSLCGKHFGRKDHLKKHLRTHQRAQMMSLSLPAFMTYGIPSAHVPPATNPSSASSHFCSNSLTAWPRIA